MELLGDMGLMEARLISFEVVLIWIQDRFTDCADCVTGSEIIVGAPDGTPR
jgi:hypothetical protein